MTEADAGVIVSEFDVFLLLKKLKKRKASITGAITNELLIELADVLAAPVASLINSSIRSGIVPQQWKSSRVTLVPKVSPATRVENDFRPISITCPISGVAEKIVAQCFDKHFEPYQDIDQYGVTKGKSTVLAIVKLCHIICCASDESCNFIRVLFVDFTKAFDSIDHTLLYNKFTECNFPVWLTTWSLDFLNNRSQFVKAGDVLSTCLVTNAGAPQGTRAGGNDFKLMINDLSLDAQCIKYVDDVSLATVSSDPYDQCMQESFDNLVDWSVNNNLKINNSKTKEMIVHFGKQFDVATVPNLSNKDVVIDKVSEFKFLGVILRDDLNWCSHVAYIISKASKRIYVISLLSRIKMSVVDLIGIYCSIVRSALEYASPVWHGGLSKAQSCDIERVQKRCLRIIFPLLSYKEALRISGLERLSARREKASYDLFVQIKHPSHPLNNLITPKGKPVDRVSTRDSYPFLVPRAKTNRMSKSLIVYGLLKKW